MRARFIDFRQRIILALTASLSVASGAIAQTGFVPPPPQFVTDPNGVDPKSTLLNYAETDLTAGSGVSEVSLVRGIPMHRTVNRQEFGKWINNFTGYAYTKYDNSDDPSPSLKIGDTTVMAVVGNKTLSFTREYMSSWEPDDPATSITTTGTTPNLTITVTDGEGTVYTFNSTTYSCQIESDGYQNFCGYLTQITKPSGETWAMDYENWTVGAFTRQRLKRARSNLQYAAVFEYASSSTDQPSKACLVNQASHYISGLTSCPSGVPAVTYTSTGAIKPDGSENIYDYSFGASDPYFGVRRPSESSYVFYYKRLWGGGAQYRRGATLSGTGGDLWSYAGTYVDTCLPSCLPSQPTQMDITGPDSAAVRYEWRDYVASGVHFLDPLPKKITNGLGNYQTIDYGLIYGFVRGTLYPKIVTLPEGNAFTYTYDDRGNRLTQTASAKYGSGLSNLVVTAAYPSTCSVVATCNKPTTFTDAKSAQTNFAYASHGGLESEMQAPPTSGAARPLKLISWTQRYAYIKNSGGSLVAASTPVWVKSSETQCQTAAGSSTPTCDSGASQTVTTYEYGATSSSESLLIKGTTVASGGVTLRTCYGYNEQGRKIYETAPRAALGSCP